MKLIQISLEKHPSADGPLAGAVLLSIGIKFHRHEDRVKNLGRA
jgi:hypothetical protein